MNNLEQITASRNFCDTLLKLGITPVSFLWWVIDDQETKSEKEKYEVAPVLNPSPGVECLPAWTKAELDSMIGPEYCPKPDLFTRQQLGNAKTLKPESYPVYTPQVMRVFENGADASAFSLIYLIEEGLLKATDCNSRYSKMFRPFKK